MPIIFVYSSTIPRRSYCFPSTQGSRCIIISILSVALTAPIPKISFTSIIPMPRSSTKCRIISGALPTSVFEDTLLISTASSATRRCPRFKSSMAVSYTHLDVYKRQAYNRVNPLRLSLAIKIHHAVHISMVCDCTAIHSQFLYPRNKLFYTHRPIEQAAVSYTHLYNRA